MSMASVVMQSCIGQYMSLYSVHSYLDHTKVYFILTVDMLFIRKFAPTKIRVDQKGDQSWVNTSMRTLLASFQVLCAFWGLADMGQISLKLQEVWYINHTRQYVRFSSSIQVVAGKVLIVTVSFS